jgi:hypothetical protein
MSSEIMKCEGWQVAKAQYQVILCHMLGYTSKKYARPHGAWGNPKLLYRSATHLKRKSGKLDLFLKKSE